MSRRIRTVKPEWLEDEVLAAASDEARVLSIGLILLADDYGNGRASIATIAAEVWRFALERDDGANAPEVLAKASRAFQELVAKQFIGVWTVNGQRYYAIRNWLKHQRVDKPGKRLIPVPPVDLFDAINAERNADSRAPREPVASVSGAVRETPAPDLDQRPGPTTQDRDLEGTTARAREAAPPAPPEAHEEKSGVIGRTPHNLTEALRLSVRERNEFVERNQHMAQWVEPEKWPEIVAIAALVHEHGGGRGPLRLAAYARDNGVRALVTLFAAGFEQPELEHVARTLTKRRYWTSGDGGKPRGLGALTVETVRRELAEAPVAREPDLLPETRAQISRDAGGMRLMREAEALAVGGQLPAPATRPVPVKATAAGALVTDLSKALGGRA